MFDLVENWRKSDLSKKLFCENHGVNIHTFNYWITKAQNEKMGTSGFIRLQPPIALIRVMKSLIPTE